MHLLMLLMLVMLVMALLIPVVPLLLLLRFDTLTRHQKTGANRSQAMTPRS